jgi:hypothetical protein
MNAIKATWKHGQIVPDEPVDWPEGCRLRVEPDGLSDTNGMSEVEQADDPESIARWIAEFDAIPPMRMTLEEEAEWQAARQAQKELQEAKFNARADKLKRLWE